MSTRWQCAVCEAINEGGETCSACGAKVTRTVMQSTPAEATSAPQNAHGDESATEIPATGPDAPYDSYEHVDTRPRVRVYGCCLPIVLGILLAFLAAVTLLGNLILGAL